MTQCFYAGDDRKGPEYDELFHRAVSVRSEDLTPPLIMVH